MRLRLIFLALIAFTCLPAFAQTCAITNAVPLGVVTAGTVTVTTNGSCPSAAFSVSCTGTGCVSGSINSSTGVYTAPSTYEPYNYSRGIQLTPNDSIYNYPVNGLAVDPRSSLWLTAIAAIRPDLIKPDHNFKLGSAPIGSLDFYNNTVTSSTPTQQWHSLDASNAGPYQDTFLPFLQPPDVLMQSGWSVDVQGCQTGCAGPDRHLFEANRTTEAETEVYQVAYDFHGVAWTRGNPTLVSFTTNTIRPMQTPLRVFIHGAAVGCTGINYVNTNASALFATVVSPGHLSIPFNSTGCGATDLNAATVSATSALCPTCNTAAALNWPGNSNAIVGGVDAAGSCITCTSIDLEQWWNNVQQAIPDPNCGGCVTAGQHVIRTTLTNQAISPRNLTPAILGTGVTGGHPNMQLLSCTNANPVVCAISTTGCGGTSCLSNQIPCVVSGVRQICSAGNTFVAVNSHLTGGWAALNGQFTATVVDLTHFSYPVDSTSFGAFPAGATFIFDWAPYGTRFRLASSFNVAAFCTPTALTDKCPYEKAFLNQLQTYGLILLDGTSQGDNWDSGVINSWFQPDQLLDAMTDLRNLCSNTQAGCLLSTGWESNLEVVDESAVQLFTGSQVYTTPSNQLQTTANQRITACVTSTNGNPCIDINVLGTTIGIDPERITMASGTTFQPTIWVNGNTNAGFSCSMSPSVAGASVSSGGLITAPVTPPTSVQRTTIKCVASADANVAVYEDVSFIPVSSDGKIRLALGQHSPSYTDSGGNVWWGQVVSRAFNSSYEDMAGVGFATLNGTWTNNCANWSVGGVCTNLTGDPQLYAQSTSEQNDTPLRIVLPNGIYTLTLYGEPGYQISAAGKNVFDVEVQGSVAASYQDGFVNSGMALYHGYTQSYSATVSNGVLNFNARQREADSGDHGMSISSLLIAPGSCTLIVTTATLPQGTMGVPYSATLAATCGTPPYTWAVSGSLPLGLGLTPSTGVISGTPTTAGTSTFTVQACDTVPNCATASLSINVVAAPPVITTVSLPSGTAGVPYSATLAATGGVPPYAWAVTLGGIPGLTMNPSTGAYTGRPTTPGLYFVSVRVTDSTPAIANKAFPTTVINPGLSTTRTLIQGGTIIEGQVVIH